MIQHITQSKVSEKYQEFFVATNPEGINNGALQNAIEIDWKLPRYQRINKDIIFTFCYTALFYLMIY